MFSIDIIVLNKNKKYIFTVLDGAENLAGACFNPAFHHSMKANIITFLFYINNM